MEFPTASYDYVCDVQWSPVHPAIFVTVNAGGSVALWNLSRSVAEPVDTYIVTDSSDDTGTSASTSDSTNSSSSSSSSSGAAAVATGTGTGTSSNSNEEKKSSSGGTGGRGGSTTTSSSRALNKVVWSNDGLSLLVGDSQGTLHYLRLNPAAVLPPGDESRFELAILSSGSSSSSSSSSSSHNMVTPGTVGWSEASQSIEDKNYNNNNIDDQAAVEAVENQLP
eukprot:CAMPEP_0175014450 /NCGR_PEP_ID=MMETSP0005-20121125/10544_1 /TAXON_ID=420556 /ORGANISM="Ochromonas sp., Strain CCMP1393" /LENGTH=222 /DNA_ID=CAMNT_0016271145 /DNA_START=17 /DNA_END=686 /DNA_ORIENTATION=+